MDRCSEAGSADKAWLKAIVPEALVPLFCKSDVVNAVFSYAVVRRMPKEDALVAIIEALVQQNEELRMELKHRAMLELPCVLVVRDDAEG